MPNDKFTPFNEEHVMEFGLAITEKSRSNNEVKSVSCKFCSFFGRHEGQVGKRKRTNNIKFFVMPFLTANYKRHLETQHTVDWANYRLLRTPNERRSFFNKELFGSTMLAHIDLEINYLRVLIPKPIVDTLIGDLLLRDEVQEADDDNDNDDFVLHFRDRAIDWFREPYEERDGEENNYCVLIKGKIQFNLVVRNVANGLSFRQAARMVQIVREETGLGKIGSCNSGLVSNYVRTVAALNFVALSKVLSSCWAFSIAFDGACSGVTTFIDLRLRFYKDDIQDFHGILIPLSGAHTGENVFLHIRKFLEVVCPAWRSKLIGASADGAANMQDHISGTVTRFAEEATAPGNIVPLTLFSPFSLPLLFSPFSFQRFF